MQKIGLNVEMVATDWGTVVQRRVSREPVEKGGWSVIHTWAPSTIRYTPVEHSQIRGLGPTEMRLGILAGPRKRIARVAHLIALQPFTRMNEMLHAKRLESSRIHAAVRSNSGSGARSQKRRIAL